jgi:hypothetical protein
MFRIILKMFYRGTGNVRGYILTVAVFEAMLLVVLYAPAGYLNEALRIVPAPSLSISDHGPGVDLHYGYLTINGREFLVFSSSNLTGTLKLLTGSGLEASDPAVGCKIDRPDVKKYVKELLGSRVEAFACMGSFIDYSIMVPWNIFQRLTLFINGSVRRVYLKNHVEDGIAVPSTFTVSRDLLKMVRFHQNFLYIISTIILTLSGFMLGLRASSDIKQTLVLLLEMHISRYSTLFNTFLVILGSTVSGVVVGYGLAYVTVPVALIFLRLLLKIPYIYVLPAIEAVVNILPPALLSLSSYTIAILLKMR